MIALAKAVPLWAWVVIALVALLGGALVYQTLALADARAEHASYIARVEKAARDAMDAARREESRRQQVINEVRNDARAQIKNADDDAAVAVATADSLQHRIDQLLADRAACITRIARGSETIRDLTVVLADLRRRADERAGELARIADASRIAGQACERAYDGLVRSSR
ncbi:DUF2514 family protein [Pseudomonas sp. R1-18]|uniref:DUF2514 family protein n=1 Tax=Pseudomonas sp. R1-18 TaxID=1632772 RepID=UPI003DA8C2A0